MHITIRRQQIQLSSDAADALLEQLTTTLGRFAGRIRKVVAYVGDVNGPRGGIDKRCRLVAELDRAGSVTVEMRDSGFGRLFSEATSRLVQAVQRHLERRRSRRVRARNTMPGLV